MTSKRRFDLIVSGAALVVLAVPLLIVAALVRTTSPGPALYWSRRVGRDNDLFAMPKFRTMRIDTPEVATDQLADPDRWLTPIGGLLRRLSIDELPQLWSIWKGDMSFVGPRPALHSQAELIALRTAAGVHALTPGLTGWAQVNGRDELPNEEKLKFDGEYMRRQSFAFDLRIIAATIAPVVIGRGVSH